MAEDSIKFGIEVDKESVARSQKALTDASKSVSKLEKELMGLSRVKPGDNIATGLSKVKTEADTAKKSMQSLADSVKVANDRFSETSNRVSLAGDVESNLRTVGGAIGSFGGTEVSGAIGAVAEVPAIIEALPKLKEAFVGLPGAIGAAAGSLGPAGLAVVGAIVAVTVVFQALQVESEKSAKMVMSTIEANRQVRENAARGATSLDAESSLGELNRLRQQEGELLKNAETLYAKSIEAQGILQTAYRLTSPEEEALATQITKSKDTVNSYDAQIRQLSIALEDGKFAVNDLARSLDSAFASERGVIEAIVGGASSEDAKKTIAQLETRIALERELQETLATQLETLDVGSTAYEAVTSQIATLESSLNSSQSSIEAYNQAIANGKFAVADAKKAEESRTKEAETAQKEADRTAEKQRNDSQRAVEKQANEQQQALDRAKQAQENYNKAINNAKTTLNNAFEDITRNEKLARQDARTKLRDDVLAQERKRADDELEVRIKNNEEQLQQARDFNRSLRDIRRDALRTEGDLIAERDFLGLRNLARDTQRRLDDERLAFDEQAQETEIQRAIESQDRQRAFEIERRERNIAFAQQLRDITENTRRQQEQARIAYNRQLEQARAELKLAQQTGQAKLNLQEQIARGEIAIISQLRDAVLGGRGSTPVTNNTTSRSQTNNVAITGNNPSAIGNEVLRVLNSLGY